MKTPRLNYDSDADVMYISFGEPKKCHSTSLIDGIMVRFAENNELNGITIIDYNERTNRTDENSKKNT